MTRIFYSLATLAGALLAASMILGLAIGDLRDEPTEEMRHWFRVHFLCGVASALAVVLVHSIVVTYFIGTSRWCKEVSETYHLDASFVQRSTVLKRRTFPWAVLGMLTVVGIISLGAAADPATGVANGEMWVNIHLAGALLGMAFIGYTFFIEWQNIEENHAVIADVLTEVRKIREERGLEV